MIEILALVFLCRSIANKAYAKGLSPSKYKWLLIGFWFAGEMVALAGFFMAVNVWAFSGGEQLFLIAAVGLGGAMLGMFAAFTAVDRAEPNYQLARCRELRGLARA